MCLNYNLPTMITLDSVYFALVGLQNTLTATGPGAAASVSMPTTFGSVPVSGQTYQSQTTVATANMIMVVIQNTSQVNDTTYTYAGQTIRIGPTEQAIFTAPLDPTSNKLVPLAVLSIAASANSPIVVFSFSKQ